MGSVGAIPLSEIAAYCQLYQLHDEEEIDTFVTMIHALDSSYLKWINDPARKKEQAAVASTKVNNRPRKGGRR